MSLLISIKYVWALKLVIKSSIFLFICFNIYDLALNFKSAKEFYSQKFYGESILEHCIEQNKPYRLKELVLDAGNITSTIIKISINPIRWINIIIISTQYSLWRITKTIMTAAFGGAIISLILTSKVRKTDLNIGVLRGVNYIESYSTLFYTIFLERAFIDAFLYIYLGIKKIKNSEKIKGFNIEKLLLYYCTGYSIFRISAVLSYERKVWEIEKRVRRDKRAKVWLRQFLEDFLNHCNSKLIGQYGHHVFVASNLLIRCENRKTWVNSKEIIKNIIIEMQEFVKKKNLTAIPVIKESMVEVGGKPHMSLGFNAINPNKFIMQDTLTFRAKIRIKNEFYTTRKNFDEGIPIHPINFEFKKAEKVYISYGSHQFTVPSLMEGKLITNASILTLQRLGEYRLIQ